MYRRMDRWMQGKDILDQFHLFDWLPCGVSFSPALSSVLNLLPKHSTFLGINRNSN